MLNWGNFSPFQLHIGLIGNRSQSASCHIAEHESLLDSCDQEEEQKELQQKINERKEKQLKYSTIQKELEASGEEQISLTDPDSRAAIPLRNIVNVGYNIQASSDSKHKLLAEYDTGTVNGTHALAPMAISTKKLLQVDHVTVLADKGYHTGEQLQAMYTREYYHICTSQSTCHKRYWIISGILLYIR